MRWKSLLVIHMAVCFCSLIFLTEAKAVTNQWEYILLDSPVSFQYLTFIDANNLAGGTSGTSMYGGNIYLSTDGAQTWNQKVYSKANISKIKFFNTQVGFATGGAESFGNTLMYLGKTADGGKTWNDISANLKSSVGSTADMPLYGLSVVSSSTIFVATSEQVYGSSNGGDTWNQKGDILIQNPDVTLNRDLQFPTALDGYVSSQNYLFRTRYGGSSWEKLTPPWNHNLGKDLAMLKFIDANNGWALVVYDYVSPPPEKYGSYLYKTMDGGQNWSIVYQWEGDKGEPYPTESLYVKSSNEIWVGGGLEEIWHSVDSGLIWAMENQGSQNIAIWGFQMVGFESVPRAIASSETQGGTSIAGYYKYIPPVEIVTTPATPSGPKIGTQGTSYTYSTSGSYSDLGHSVQYFFDWGDGTNSGWLAIGATSASKSWDSIGIYTAKAQARCATDTSVISDWSSELTVAIGSSCTSWGDVISKYNEYVSGTATWTDVIETYNQYVSNPC